MVGARAPTSGGPWARFLAPLAAGLVAALVACGAQEEAPVPLSCTSGPDAVRRALADAPAPVTVGGTPLSDCVAAARSQGDLQGVGGVLVDVASELASRARSDPRARETLELGYLVGAARRGAVPGIHDELLRRLEQELVGVDTGSEAFERGERAGRTSG
jgi:hypothetical protein